MTFVLGYLPDDIDENDITKLFSSITGVIKVTFLEKTECKHSCYECLVEVELVDPIVGYFVAYRMNNYSWRNNKISARMLVW